MAYILHIETTTTQCSVGLSKDGKIIALSEYNDEQYSHSEKLHLYTQECLQQASITLMDLDAVAVSKGPGSYTGLRIGVSAAKGICFALDIPLISVSTLLSLSHQATVHSGVIIPYWTLEGMKCIQLFMTKIIKKLEIFRQKLLQTIRF